MTSRIVTYGSPVLRKIAEPITENTELEQTVNRMFSILNKGSDKAIIVTSSYSKAPLTAGLRPYFPLLL